MCEHIGHTGQNDTVCRHLSRAGTGGPGGGRKPANQHDDTRFNTPLLGCATIFAAIVKEIIPRSKARR